MVVTSPDALTLNASLPPSSIALISLSMDTDGSLTVTDCEALATVASSLFNLAVTVPDPALQAYSVKFTPPEEGPETDSDLV